MYIYVQGKTNRKYGTPFFVWVQSHSRRTVFFFVFWVILSQRTTKNNIKIKMKKKSDSALNIFTFL